MSVDNLVLCDECFGEGKVKYGVPTAKYQEPADYDVEVMECEVCNGNGMVKS